MGKSESMLKLWGARVLMTTAITLAWGCGQSGSVQVALGHDGLKHIPYDSSKNWTLAFRTANESRNAGEDAFLTKRLLAVKASAEFKAFANDSPYAMRVSQEFSGCVDELQHYRVAKAAGSKEALARSVSLLNDCEGKVGNYEQDTRSVP